MKTCPRCKREMPLSAYASNRSRSDGLQWACRECWKKYQQTYYSRHKPKYLAKNRDWKVANPARYRRAEFNSYLTRTYGITAEEYDRMYNAQGEACAICRQHKSSRRLGVDHCHKTGTVRGLLCNPCNFGIGALEDSKENLERAIAYLARFD